MLISLALRVSLTIQSGREYSSAITSVHLELTSCGHSNFVRLSIVAMDYAVCAAISQLFLAVKLARDKEASHRNYKCSKNLDESL